MKADKTVVTEAKYISSIVIILSLIMQSVFLVIGRWDYKVLLGNLLSALAGILNFYLMGLTVQKAITEEESYARKRMKASQSLRNLGMFVVIVIGVVLPCFNKLAVIIPVFFPRIAVSLRPLIKNKDEKDVNKYE